MDPDFQRDFIWEAPRQSELSPKAQRRSNGVYWVVSLGRKYTGGKRQRRYFRNRKDAKGFVQQAEQARHKLGLEALCSP